MKVINNLSFCGLFLFAFMFAYAEGAVKFYGKQGVQFW